MRGSFALEGLDAKGRNTAMRRAFMGVDG
jgi:hypothetical protein